ncbi:MAG: glycosyltransferase family 39 protein [Candidatus Omnitrophica bacterium]|nr:glycosyltransferase family 39 protein [Candidatus Omnitrophota bacterium]MBU1808073.1 glycosyltransferase family 39 protein [Candidatus Omnitrophota bacterium]
MKANNSISSKFSLAALILICIGSLAITFPTIANNSSNPDLITYFSADEGGLMDEAWYYYSGEKRDSFQWDIDYGLEMVYVADLSRAVLSKFMKIGPGTLVLILRWIHLLSWLGALVALWLLIGRHFGKGWGQAIAVALLAVRPALLYFMNSLKPEPLVLLLIIVGLDYTLRIVEKPARSNVVIAVACAAAAMVVKFSGIFLLPVIVGALYLGDIYRAAPGKGLVTTRAEAKFAWTFPMLLSIPMIAAPFLAIFFYVRRHNGLTLYQEYGLVQSMSLYKIVYLVWFAAAALIAVSFLMFTMNRSKNRLVIKVMQHVNRINSYAIIVGAVFSVSFAVFGARWFTMPRHFIDTYVYNGMDFSGGEVVQGIRSAAEFFTVFFKGVWEKIISFDPVIFTFIGLYIINETRLFERGGAIDRAGRYKRCVLLIFLLPFFASIFTMGRLAGHHMLPFFMVAAILAVQAAEIFTKINRKYLCLLVYIILLADIGVYGIDMARSNLYKVRQREDTVFTIARWWRVNVPPDARIVAQHHMQVYVPEEYKNVRRLHWNGKDEEAQLRKLIREYSPRYIYHRKTPDGTVGAFDIETVLPEKKLRLIKVFDDSGIGYRRTPGEKFFIHEISD